MGSHTLTGVLLIGLLLTVAPRIAGAEPAVYATIPLEKNHSASDAHFSPDGKYLAFFEGTLKDGRIVLWDVAKKERTAAFETKRLFRQMVWSPDGKAIYAADLGGVYRVDVAIGKRAELYGHGDIVTALKYLPDTKQLVSAAEDGSIVVWDAAKDKLVKELNCPQNAHAVDAQPVPGTSKLAVVATYATLQIGGPKGVVLHGLSESNMQKALESAKDGTKVVVHSHKVLYVADLADGTFATALKDPPVSDDRRQLAAPHAGGEYAFSDLDKEVAITDVTTGKSRTVTDCPVYPFACRFSPSDRYLFVGGCDKDRVGGLAVYDLTTEEWVGRVATKGRTVSDLTYSESSNLLTCTSGDGADRQITVWDMKGIVDPTATKKKKEEK